MHQHFLSAMQAIDSAKLTTMVGLYLIHGDDPLVLSWFVDACRPLFKQHQQTIKRYELTNAKIWQEVVAELDSLSLFADSSAVLVVGKQKCDDIILKRLHDFALAVQAGQSTHCLIYQLPKQDKKAQNTKLYQLFAKHGTVVDCHIYHETQRRDVLVYQAHKFGLTLSSSAWQFLLEHTENHLLAAYQALWRAADLYQSTTEAPKKLKIEALLPVLVSDYQYSVFYLCDTLLAGEAKKSLHILNHLRQVGTAPSVILWAIAKEIRQVLALQSGKNPSELGIWQSKMSLYRQAQKRQSIHPSQLILIYDLDKNIKGLGLGNIWQGLAHLCLLVCGVNVLDC